MVPHISKARALLVKGRTEISEQGRSNMVADTIRLGTRIDSREAEPREKDSNTD